VVPFLWTKSVKESTVLSDFNPGFEPGPAWPLLCCSSALPTELRGHTLKFERICCTIVTCAKIVLIKKFDLYKTFRNYSQKNKKQKNESCNWNHGNFRVSTGIRTRNCMTAPLLLNRFTDWATRPYIKIQANLLDYSYLWENRTTITYKNWTFVIYKGIIGRRIKKKNKKQQLKNKRKNKKNFGNVKVLNRDSNPGPSIAAFLLLVVLLTEPLGLWTEIQWHSTDNIYFKSVGHEFIQ